MRFIATADWQLGMAASFLDDEARPRYVQSRFDAIRRIGRLAAEREVDLIVVAGDVFDSNQLDRKVLSRAFEALREVPVPVYLLPGNHDALDATSIYRSEKFLSDCPSHVHVLDTAGVHPVESLPGVEIVAAPWATRKPVTDLVADACGALTACPGRLRILVGHGQVDLIDPDPSKATTISTKVLQGALDSGCLQFAVLGDRHATTSVAPRIWHPGTLEVTRRVEDDPGNVLVVDLDEHSVEVESVRVGSWTFDVVTEQVDSDEDLDAFDALLASMERKEERAVWLALSGALSIQQKARLDDIIETHRDVFAHLALWERKCDLSVVPSDHDFTLQDLSAAAQDAVDEIVGLARRDSPEALVAQDALGLLYRMTRGSQTSDRTGRAARTRSAS